MSKSSLFQLGDVKNHPRRSAFDMDRKVSFTAKVGEILPVDWTFVLPGDKVKLGLQSFTRTAPSQSCAFTRIKEYYEWFYVPVRMLWRWGGDILMNMSSQVNSATGFSDPTTLGADFAKFSTKELMQAIGVMQTADGSYTGQNVFGFNRGELSAKLLSYLRYGKQFKWVSNGGASAQIVDLYRDDMVSVLPLLAYHKFYYDHFRNPQWEKKKPYLYNIDYYTGQGRLPWTFNKAYFEKHETSLLDIHYCNWQKDMFFGAMPSSQFGDVATVNFDVTGLNQSRIVITGEAKVHGVARVQAGSEDAHSMLKSGAIRTYNPVRANEPQQITSGVEIPTGHQHLFANSDYDEGLYQNTRMKILGKDLQANPEWAAKLQGEFSILQLRAKEALQRWKEITQAGDQSYVGQLYAHFGVKADKNLNMESTRLCGTSSDIAISEVINQNLVDAPADIRGRGVGSCSEGLGTYEFKEHGVLMCLYHSVPLLDYEQMAPDPQLLTTTTAASWPVPEFDNLGLDEVPIEWLSSDKKFDSQFSAIQRLGYAPRYLPWKTTTDIVLGGFDIRNVDLYSWVCPVNDEYLEQYFGDGKEPSPVLAMTHYWFKVNPSLLNNIFAVIADASCKTDTFRVNSLMSKTIVRNLDYDGMPY